MDRKFHDSLELLVAGPPAGRQVFVNRNLRMNHIDYVGFDLDWTLAEYSREALGRQTFSLVIDGLINRAGYPPAIAQADYRPDFQQRGLLIDKLEGSVIKMNRHRYVGAAFIGRRRLEREERRRIYRRQRIDISRDRFYRIDSLFELPELSLFSELVELRAKASGIPTPERIFLDVRSEVDRVHRDGTLKTVILSRLPEFLPRRDELVLALEKLRLEGKKLLLISNSEWYYVNALCTYLLDSPAWRSHFDVVVVRADKPRFFRERRPFLELDGEGNAVNEVMIPAWNHVYQGGCREGLMALLGEPGEKVLYIGDHVYEDILWTRISSTWRTALVIEELEAEVGVQNHRLGEIAASIRRGSEIYELSSTLSRLREAAAMGGVRPELKEELAATTCQLADLERDQALRSSCTAEAFGKVWGSLFKQGTSKSLFAEQVEDFACVYTSRASNFLFYGADHYFQVLVDLMRHEQQSERD
jgi:5'-nucleotidase